MTLPLTSDAILTAAEVAAWLKIKPRQVQRFGIPCVDLGRKTKRYIARDILAWLEGHRVGGSTTKRKGDSQMTITHWGHETLPNLEFWDELNAIVAQWICHERARGEVTPGNHNDNPAAPEWSCNSCFHEAVDMIEAGFRHLFQTYGSMAYTCGLDGVPESEAARRALEAMIRRFRPDFGKADLDTL